MSKIDASFIDDIFGIPKDGSNISDDDEGIEISNEKPTSFDEKISEISATISSVETRPEKVVVKTNKEVVNSAQSAIPVTKKSNNSMFDDIFVNISTVIPVEAVEDKPEVKVLQEKTIEVTQHIDKKTIEDVPKPVKSEISTKAIKENESALPTQVANVSSPMIIAGKATKHKWRLDAPSPKYERFYSAKREALEDALLKGGELPFDKYFEELENANVDVTVGETFQSELVCKKMSDCQKHRERIKQVQLRVNRQFFQWERHMDLFEGLLSRIEYERGKQEGVKYEHMYDMESYFGELKSLYKSIDNVMRVLDSAFECLSRQVTITMPMKDIERYNTSKPYNSSLSGYDGLKKQPNSASSVGDTVSKETAKAVESQPSSGWGIVN